MADTPLLRNKAPVYVTTGPLTADQVLEKAAELVAGRYVRELTFNRPKTVKDYLTVRLGQYEREVFAVLLLDQQHRLIDCIELFYGTVNAASVYPREVVKVALQSNAAALIAAHNHPSGATEPSEADLSITRKLNSALELLSIRLLDHFIVGESVTSLAERGLMPK